MNKNFNIETSKFSFCIMNPPYDGELHIKFLEKVINISNYIVNISPIDWLLRTPNYFKKNSQFYKYFDEIKDYCTGIETFNILENFGLFNGARISNILAIQTYNTFKKTNYLTDITINSPEAKICEKIFKYAKNENIDMYLEKDKKYGYRVKFGRIGGGNWTARKPHTLITFKEVIIDGKLSNGDPHWKIASINQYTKKTDTMAESLLFYSKEDAQNFIDIYNNTKLMKYYLAFMHQDMHIHPEYLPYFSGDKLKYRDKELCKLFNISGYISDNKAEKNSDWENILKLFE